MSSWWISVRCRRIVGPAKRCPRWRFIGLLRRPPPCLKWACTRRFVGGVGIGRHSRSFVDYGGVLLMCSAGPLLPEVGVHSEAAGWHGRCCPFSLAGQIKGHTGGAPGGRSLGVPWRHGHIHVVRESWQRTAVSSVVSGQPGGPPWGPRVVVHLGAPQGFSRHSGGVGLGVVGGQLSNTVVFS